MEKTTDRFGRIEERLDKIERKVFRKGLFTRLLRNAVSEDIPQKKEKMHAIGSYYMYIGIGMLLLGIAFFFKYAVEQGWITAALRIALGFILGGAGITGGLKLGKTRRALGEILTGGGIVVLYITVMSGFRLERIFGYAPSFVLFTAITALAYWLSIRRAAISLSVVGAFGGLVSLMVMYRGIDDIKGMVLFNLVIAIGSALVVYLRRWYALAWPTFLGSWAVLGFAAVQFSEHSQPEQFSGAKLVLLSGVFILLAVQFVTPALLPQDSGRSGASGKLSAAAHHFLFVPAPLAAFFITSHLYSRSSEFWGVTLFIASLVYGALALALSASERGSGNAFTTARVALLLLVMSFLYLFDDAALLAVLSCCAIAVHFINARTKDLPLLAASHAMYILLRLWILYLLIFSRGVSTGPGTMDLSIAFAITALMISVRFRFNATHARYYFLSSHILLVVYLYSLLPRLTSFPGSVSAAWTAIALVFYVIGFAKENYFLSRISLATMLLVIARLFFIDLGRMDTLWRVALLVVSGSTILLLSYIAHGPESFLARRRAGQ